MYWAMKKPSGASLTGLWLGRRRLAEFEGRFAEGAEVIVSKGKPTGWSLHSRIKGKPMYSLYVVVDGKLKKQKTRAAGVNINMNTRTDAEESQKVADDFIEVAMGESWRNFVGGSRDE